MMGHPFSQKLELRCASLVSFVLILPKVVADDFAESISDFDEVFAAVMVRAVSC